MAAERNIVVVGAGIAGLTLCCKLSAAGYKPVLVEKEGVAGGLARSFTYEGGYTFDIGPHRFYTEVPAVLDFIHHVLDGDFIKLGRKSAVRMFDRYFDWPLERSALLRLPPGVFIAVARDFLKNEKHAGESFEAYILNAYGRTLYEIFFKPYTEKFLGLPCDRISRDWAITGIDRAVIDNSIKVNSLLSLARSVFFPRPPLDFIYPVSGGIGLFADKMVDMVTSQGGEVLLDSPLTGVVHRAGRVTKVLAGGRELPCDLLVWTAPVTGLASLLGIADHGLHYLSLLLYNYIVAADRQPDYQWCYFGAADVPFNRVSFPTNFNPRLAPPGGSGICIEVTCRQDDDVWRNPEEKERSIRAAMLANGIVDPADRIVACYQEKVANAYPVYDLDYSRKLAALTTVLGEYAGLELLGRSGGFWYNNMDHSIEAALDLADKIITGSS